MLGVRGEHLVQQSLGLVEVETGSDGWFEQERLERIPAIAVVSDAAVIGIIENVVNINRIPSRRFRFCGLPLPLVGLTGSPLRAVAEV